MKELLDINLEPISGMRIISNCDYCLEIRCVVHVVDTDFGIKYLCKTCKERKGKK